MKMTAVGTRMGASAETVLDNPTCVIATAVPRLVAFPSCLWKRQNHGNKSQTMQSTEFPHDFTSRLLSALLVALSSWIVWVHLNIDFSLVSHMRWSRDFCGRFLPRLRPCHLLGLHELIELLAGEKAQFQRVQYDQIRLQFEPWRLPLCRSVLRIC